MTDPPRRDRLRELLDAVTDASNSGVSDMARSSYASDFHFSREVRRLTGESPAALRRTYGLPPSQAAEVHFRLPAPNGLHFHPPQSLWLDSPWSGGCADDAVAPDVSKLMMAHDLDDTAHSLAQAAQLTPRQWVAEVAPGQTVMEWDGPEPSVAAVLGALVWTKEVWLATIAGEDFPPRSAIRRSPSSCTASWCTCSPTPRTAASWHAPCSPATAYRPDAATRWTG